MSMPEPVEELAKVLASQCSWRTVYMGHSVERAKIERVTIDRMAAAALAWTARDERIAQQRRAALRIELLTLELQASEHNRRRENECLIGQRDAADAALTLAREMLGELEWTAKIMNGLFTEPACHWCGRAQSEGHAPDCRWARAVGT